MAFTDMQLVALEAKLKARHVKVREKNGKTLSYVEGWHAIAEANRIFGFDGWSRETVASDCVWQGVRRHLKACTYTARVRIRVMAGEREIIREGSGSGHGTGTEAGEAHESALKEAETDAMKRALTTFGNPFGLALYDKEQRGVTRRVPYKPTNGHSRKLLWELKGVDGRLHSQHTEPVDYCANLRRMVEGAADQDALKALWQQNQRSLLILKDKCPDLKSDRGQHYVDILTVLYASRHRALGKPEQPEQQRANGSEPGGDMGLPAAIEPSPRRLRNRKHLKYVASQPCVICGRNGTQAHHVRFAQPRAMGRKVGDQWTVPLCALHHRAVHDAGDEERWWKEQDLDSLQIAEKLWGEFSL